MAEQFLIDTQVFYLPEQSDANKQQFVFAYTITITNNTDQIAQLMTRHWLVHDANGKIQEVHGEGVVGEQPVLKPGESYQYTSGAVLETPIGTMQGSYQMKMQSGEMLDAPIKLFSLTKPETLN